MSIEKSKDPTWGPRERTDALQDQDKTGPRLTLWREETRVGQAQSPDGVTVVVGCGRTQGKAAWQDEHRPPPSAPRPAVAEQEAESRV